jgi:hypothetical protein
MAKYIHEYTSTKGFFPLHKCNNHSEAISKLYFGDKCYHSFNPSQEKKYPHSGFFGALANPTTVSRALNAVFILIRFGIPARGVLCLATNCQTFPTTSNYSPY